MKNKLLFISALCIFSSNWCSSQPRLVDAKDHLIMGCIGTVYGLASYFIEKEVASLGYLKFFISWGTAGGYFRTFSRWYCNGITDRSYYDQQFTSAKNNFIQEIVNLNQFVDQKKLAQESLPDLGSYLQKIMPNKEKYAQVVVNNQALWNYKRYEISLQQLAYTFKASSWLSYFGIWLYDHLKSKNEQATLAHKKEQAQEELLEWFAEQPDQAEEKEMWKEFATIEPISNQVIFAVVVTYTACILIPLVIAAAA